ncbi:MAG TPA: hypothetical protein PKX48_09265 [Planctomycetota bacterium]|jgi:hypothetical protein|nr:hypothetical protein [Planctomycetota bacterium]OQC20973.1 MAG: hypothetical protein BWX69_01383 [Planctomycetes bacterium ADurb.Bin069]HNR98469.1 hypothetical protein [Planctomycetota bacterium]HNU25111.1 hypothetical protein [Planctomycetota bacterium]HOE30099.1 hypothetical protein [Planctomycetota bacterium]
MLRAFVLCAVLVPGVAASAALTDGLLVYYDFEQLVGGDGVPDRSPNGFDGLVGGGGSITLAEGVFGQAAHFQGPLPVYVALPTPMPHDAIPTKAITVAVWVNHDPMTTDQMEIFMPMSGGEYQKQLGHFELRNNNTARFLLRTPVDPPEDFINMNNVGAVPAKEWVHYAATYDSVDGVGRLYINGEIVGEAFATREMYNNWDTGARVGYCVDNARPFFGYMDDFAIWSRALSQDEIYVLMDKSIPVPPPPIEITIDGDFSDWAYLPALIKDPADVFEPNGDIKAVYAHSTADTLYARIAVYGTAAPRDAQRYYYHILIDADNDPATGFDNSEYEGNPTGVVETIGADFYIMIGRKNGADDGLKIYFCRAGGYEKEIAWDVLYAASGDSIELAVPYASLVPEDDLGAIFKPGQTFKIAAFQEGNANDWEVDWTESAEVRIPPAGNMPPVVSIEPAAAAVALCGESVSCSLTVTAVDPENDPLTYQWSVSGSATIVPGDPPATAVAAFTAVGEYTVTCAVSDGTSIVTVTATVTVEPCADVYIHMGDANCDHKVDIADAVCILGYLFGAPGTACKTQCCAAAEDANGDDKVDIADAVKVLGYLFTSGDLVAPDGTILRGAAVGCAPYRPEDVKLECATPCR